MTWRYSFNPGYSAKDQTRFLIQDTNKNDPQLEDEEIEWVLSQYNNTPLNAAIRCCEVLVAKYTRMADEQVGQVKIQFSQKAKSYMSMRLMLANRLATEDCAPFAGGISRTQKQQNWQNTDNVRPDFTKHMMENDQIAPWTTQTEYNFWLGFGG